MSINTSKSIPFLEEIKKIATEIRAEVYIVGGSVRDILLCKDIKDVDLVIFNIDYQKFAFKLSKYLKAPAVNFKDNVRILKDAIVIDVSAPRGENIYEDLQKRDFTINNLAADLNGNVVGDTKDIENKKISVVHEDAFSEDALRVFRAFRFYSSLGFEIDEKTLKLIDKQRHLLQNIARERILEELKKTIDGDNFENAIDLLIKHKITDEINLKDINADNAKKIKKIAAQLGKEKALPAIIATSIKDYKKTTKALMFSNQETKFTELVALALAEFDKLDLENIEAIQKAAWKYYENLPILSLICSAISPDKKNVMNLLEKEHSKINYEASLKINGEVLKSLGFSPSPIFKKIIDDVAERLALNQLEVSEILNYINKKYGKEKF